MPTYRYVTTSFHIIGTLRKVWSLIDELVLFYTPWKLFSIFASFWFLWYLQKLCSIEDQVIIHSRFIKCFIWWDWTIYSKTLLQAEAWISIDIAQLTKRKANLTGMFDETLWGMMIGVCVCVCTCKLYIIPFYWINLYFPLHSFNQSDVILTDMLIES